MLNKLAETAYDIAKLRESHNSNVSTDTMKMLKHCATEVVEATEAYVKASGDDVADDVLKMKFRDELADIICCVLIIAGKEKIDLQYSVLSCIDKNKRRAYGKGDKL